MIVVELSGQDRIEIQEDPYSVKVMGCSQFVELIFRLRDKYGDNIADWEVPISTDHAALLVKEAILKFRGQWDYPYKHSELCHCRCVLTETADNAVIRGAHSSAEVSRLTSASTSCGTCKADVESIIKYRLKTS